MSFFKKLRQKTLFQRVPQFLKKPQAKKRKKSLSSNPRKRRKKTLNTLSKLDINTANAIFKIHDEHTENFESAFLLMVLDLRIMFPKLPVFESHEWLHYLCGVTNALAESTGPTLLQNEYLVDRLEAIFQASDAYGRTQGERKFNILGACGVTTCWKESIGASYPDGNQITGGSTQAYAESIEAKALREGAKIAPIANWYKSWRFVKLGSEVLALPVERLTRPEETINESLLREDGTFSRNYSFHENTKVKILKILPPEHPLGISFQEALWIINACKHLKPEFFKKFIQNWERILIPSKQWLAALCLLSAVKTSTFSKYLGHLRQLCTFVNTWVFEPQQKALPIEVLVNLIHTNSMPEQLLIEFAQWRMTRVKFRTMRADFTALAFFFRHLPDKPVDFWNSFPKLREVLKSLGKWFDEEAEGSIFLEWKDMKTFLLFVLQHQFHDTEAQTIFDCFILSYWFALRISEACDLWFDNVRILPASDTQGERLQLCIVDSKTNTRKTPWNLVTLNALPEKDWVQFCPVQAFKRLLAKRQPGQNHLFLRKNGKHYTKDWMTKTFSSLRTAFRKAEPGIVSQQDKFTFHVFRISAIGFYIRDMGFTVYEAQTISRHKLGSRTTEEIYLAKGKAAFAKSLARKIQDYIAETGLFPTATEEDDFLLYADSAKMAKRYKTFTNIQNQTNTENFPPPKPIISERTQQKLGPELRVGKRCRVPFVISNDHEDPKLQYFLGTLTQKDTRNGVDGYWVKWDKEDEPSFIDTLSLLECQP